MIHAATARQRHSGFGRAGVLLLAAGFLALAASPGWAQTWTITASAGGGGAISPSGAVSVSNGNSSAFTFTPSTGYQVLDVQVDGQWLSVIGGLIGTNGRRITTYTFSNVTS